MDVLCTEEERRTFLRGSNIKYQGIKLYKEICKTLEGKGEVVLLNSSFRSFGD